MVQNSTPIFDQRVYAQDSAPVDERDGNIWADTSSDPPVVKVYSAGSSAWERAAPSSVKTQDTAPGSPGEGDLWVDTSEAPPEVKTYSGTAWNGVGNRGASELLEFREARLATGEMNGDNSPEGVINEYTSGSFEWTSGQETSDDPTFDFRYPPAGIKEVQVTVSGNASSVDVEARDGSGNSDRVNTVQNTTVSLKADFVGPVITVQVYLNDSLYTQRIDRCQLRTASI